MPTVSLYSTPITVIAALPAPIKVTVNLSGIGPAGTPGEPGPQGPPGESASGAAYYSETWNFTTKTSDAANGGEIGLNAADWTSATMLNLNEETSTNRDMTPAFSTIFKPNNQLLIAVKTDASKFGRYTISGFGLDQGTFWQFPLTLVEAGGTLPGKNDDVMVTVLVV